jgi:endonuclease-3 related protein
MPVSAKRIKLLYDRLYAAYGPQGWWPVRGPRGVCDAQGYHPGDYSLPDTPGGRFEVAVGAVLTQNTAWTNVRRAHARLREARLLSPRKMLIADMAALRAAIRSSGYFNEKAKKLKGLAALLEKEGWLKGDAPIDRDRLLAAWGIGPETADSILLYAFRRPFFVVDAYTRRLLVRLGWIEEGVSYDDIQKIFHGRSPRRAASYNEFHALIVAHAKAHCRKRPACVGCPLLRMCRCGRDRLTGK